MDRRLVSDIVGRLQKELPWEFRAQGATGLQHGEAVLELLQGKEAKTLVALCRSRAPVVLEVVAALLDNLLKSLKPGMEDTDWLRLSQSHYIVLGLIRLGLERVDSVQKDKPPLDQKIVEFIVQLCAQFLGSKELLALVKQEPKAHPAMAVMLMNKAGQVINRLSKLCFAAVFRKVDQQFLLLKAPSKGSEEQADLQVLSLIEYLHYDYRNLNNMLLKLSQSAASVKKEYQFFFARVLRQAIWNWIYDCPAEFAALSQKIRKADGDLLPTGAESLFAIVDQWSDASKRKGVFWPVQTMLLVLCPDLLFQALDSKTSPRKSIGAKFLESLKKSMKTKQLSDLASLCYVDICKASTFVKKAENNALRYIVPSIESELKERLFNPQKPILLADGTLDQKIMVDCMVSAYRLNARNAIGSLFKVCLDTTSPPGFRLVLVKSLESIATDPAPLPWNPTLKISYGTAPQMRALLNELIVPKARMERRGQRGKDAQDVAMDVEIMETVLRLYLSDPDFALVSITSQGQDLTRDARTLMGGLCSCLIDESNPDIPYHASKLLIELHNEHYVEQWCPPDVMKGVWEVSAEVLNSTARMLIHKEDLESVKVLSLIDTLSECLIRRNEFLRHRKDDLGLTNEVWDMRNRANTNLEVSLLIHLCSGDTLICSKVSALFGILCDEVDVLEEVMKAREDDESRIQMYLKSQDIGANYALWRQLSRTGVLQTGRVAQMKNIHQLLRDVETPTQGVTAAWQMMFRRWDTTTREVLKRVAEQKQSSEEGAGSEIKELMKPSHQFQWHFYTGMLAALVTAAPQSSEKASLYGSPQSSTSGQASYSSGSMKKGKNLSSATPNLVESFLKTVLDIITCDVAVFAEPILPIIATTLNVMAYPILFNLLNSIISQAFGKEGEVYEDAATSLFVSQGAVLVEKILDRPQHSDDLALADFELLVGALVRYSSQLRTQQSTLRIKARICSLLDHIVRNRDLISFKNEKKFRNKLVFDIMEWTSYFSSQSEKEVESDTQSSKKDKARNARQVEKRNEIAALSDEEKRLQRELDVSGVTTVTNLLQGLSLEMVESSTAGEGTGKEIKTMLFETVFVYLSGALTRSKQDAAVSKVLPAMCVTALSNLLYSNIEIGLEYFINMGYIDDTETRSAFLVVLTNILKQGAGFETLADEETKDKYTAIEQLLFSDDLALVKALMSTVVGNELDEIATYLVALFDSVGQSERLLKEVLAHEVEMTESENTLFRRNSGAAKLFFVFSRMIGTPYLKEMWGATIDAFLAEPDHLYEVDPSRLMQSLEGKVPKEQMETEIQRMCHENTEKLLKLCQQVVDRILEQRQQLPYPLRQILCFLEICIDEKFAPGDTKGLVGGFVFLRFLNPALVSADVSGLTAYNLDRNSRRTLVLVTKVMQNLGNQIKFGSKESYMEPMNVFIESNIVRISDFSLHCTTLPEDDAVGPPVAPIEFVREDAFAVIHYNLQQNLMKIGSFVSSMTKSSELYDSLASALVILGPPPEIRKKAVSAATGSEDHQTQVYLAFMSRMSGRSTEELEERQMFYRHGVSIVRNNVFYLVLRKFDPDMDMDLCIYFILRTLEPYFTKPYDIVMDATGFQLVEGAFQMSWIQKFLKLIPPGASNNCFAVYILNPSSYFHSLGKVRKMISSKALKKVFFLSATQELHAYIAAAEIGLPPATANLESDGKSTFSPVTRIVDKRRGIEKEVVLKVSASYLHFVSVKESIFGKPVTTHDLCSFGEMVKGVNRLQGDEFSVVVEGFLTEPKGVLLYRSSVADQAVQAIKKSLTRQELVHKESAASARASTIRPEDVPGALLNMALLNLGSPTNESRVAAYNLLTALMQTFKFTIGQEFLEAEGLFVPNNTTHYVITVSHLLAQSERQITLEFLHEAIHNFDKVSYLQKSLCLEYMQSWIRNLGLFVNAEDEKQVNRLHELVGRFVTLSLEQKELYSLVLKKIWPALGEVDELVPFVIDELVSTAVRWGVESPKTLLLCEMCISLGITRNKCLSSVIIQRLLSTINRCKAPVIVPGAKKSGRMHIGPPPSAPPPTMGSTVALNIPKDVPPELPRHLEPPGMDPAGMDSKPSPPKPKRGLISHPLFPEIVVQCRFLQVLAFQDLLQVADHLAELFHIILMLFPETSLRLRDTIHSLLINMLHSLTTKVIRTEKAKGELRTILAEMNRPKYRLMFLGSSGTSGPKGELARVPLSTVEQVAGFLLDIHNICVNDHEELAEKHWLEKWQGFTKEVAFKDNITLKLRSFVVLGTVTEAPVEDELFTEVLHGLTEGLTTFMTAVNKFIMSGGQYDIPQDDCDLAVAVIVCLTQLVQHIPTTSGYFKRLFWLTMALVQVSDLTVFPYAVTLMETLLRTYDAAGCFHEMSVEKFLTDDQSLPPRLQATCSRLEQVVGLRYAPVSSQFSFAVAGTLMKGLKHPATKTGTSKLLNLFMDIATRHGVGSTCLGYLAALAPTSTKEGLAMLWQKVGRYQDGTPVSGEAMFSPQMLPDETSAILLVALLVTILKDAEYEQEQLFLYNLLREGVQSIPSVFPLVQELLTKKMSAVLHSSQNQEILGSVLDIVASMLILGTQTTTRLNLAYLNQIGFQGLLDCGIFRPLGQTAGKKEVILQLTISVVEELIALAEER